MAAPSYKSSIKWGSILSIDSTHKGKIGLYITTTSTTTQTKVKTEIWFQSMYWTRDTTNTLKADWDATTASTSQGSVSIDNYIEDVTDTGTGWNDGTMVLIKTMEKTYNKSASAATKNFAASLTGISGITGTMTVTSTFTIPALATYTITYNANGGSGAPSATTYTYSASGTVTLSSTEPTRVGYTFSGWNTNSSGTGTNYSAGGSFSRSITGNTTLYAVWTVNTYTVSYSANGHGTAPSSQTKTYGTNLTLRSFISNATATGYKVTFNANGGSSTPTAQTSTLTYKQTYWNTNSSGTGTNYSSGGTYTSNAATTLYAIWSKTNGAVTLASAISRANASATGYKVTFNANGGSCSTSSLTAARTTSYSFGGWNTNSSGTGTNYSAGTSYTPTEAVTLYAKWNASTSTASITLPTASRTGYTFKGWSTSSSATSASYGGGTSYTPSGATTLYAVWGINSCTLTVNPNGGSWNSTTSNSTFTQNYGTTKAIANPTRTGYSFSKWTLSGGGSLSGTTYTFGTSNGTLTASWVANTYTISYNANGGSGAPSSQTKTHDVNLTLSSTKPTRTGYTFLGWSTSSSATSATYSAGGTYTNNATVTLYAVWERNTNCFVKVNGVYTGGMMYVKNSGTYVPCQIYSKLDGVYK